MDFQGHSMTDITIRGIVDMVCRLLFKENSRSVLDVTSLYKVDDTQDLRRGNSAVSTQIMLLVGSTNQVSIRTCVSTSLAAKSLRKSSSLLGASFGS